MRYRYTKRVLPVRRSMLREIVDFGVGRLLDDEACRIHASCKLFDFLYRPCRGAVKGLEPGGRVLHIGAYDDVGICRPRLLDRDSIMNPRPFVSVPTPNTHRLVREPVDDAESIRALVAWIISKKDSTFTDWLRKERLSWKLFLEQAAQLNHFVCRPSSCLELEALGVCMNNMHHQSWKGTEDMNRRLIEDGCGRAPL